MLPEFIHSPGKVFFALARSTFPNCALANLEISADVSGNGVGIEREKSSLQIVSKHRRTNRE